MNLLRPFEDGGRTSRVVFTGLTGPCRWSDGETLASLGRGFYRVDGQNAVLQLAFDVDVLAGKIL